jgi:hypothetical protein
MSSKALVVTIAAAALLGAALVAAQSAAPRPMTSRAAQDARPLPPLPTPGFAPARPADMTRQVYEFAARFPEVLKYVPCYCGCESSGHPHNESCFVQSRDAQGHVTAWDMHGYG